MILKFMVEVELSHARGKFVGKEELRESIINDHLDGSSPSEIMVEDSEYTVDNWTVTDVEDDK